MSVLACFSASSAVSHSNKCSLLTFVLYIVFIIEFNVIIALLGRKLISNIPLNTLAFKAPITGIIFLCAEI